MGSGIANDVICYEETSRREVNDVQSDARLLSDDNLRELFGNSMIACL